MFTLYTSISHPFFAHILMTFTYFEKKCVFSNDFIIGTIKLLQCHRAWWTEIWTMHYWEFPFCKSLTGHLRILASSSVSVCSLLAYPETCEQFLDNLFFFLYSHQNGNFLMISELGKASTPLPLWNYEKKAGDIFFLFLIALPRYAKEIIPKTKQKKKNENCQRLFLWNRDFSLSKIHRWKCYITCSCK